MAFSSSLPREYIAQMTATENTDLSDIDENEVLETVHPIVNLPSNANARSEHDDSEDDDIFAMDEENVDRQKPIRTHSIKLVDSDGEEDDYLRGGSRAYSVSGWVGDNSNDGFDFHCQSNAVETTAANGPLAYGTSLPITIPNKFWPPAEATDSFRTDENGEQPQAMTILPQRDQDLYSVMRDQARSIQAPDNPERLFGERPRRRHRTGESPGPVPFRVNEHDDNSSPPVICGSVTH
uniref:Similar to n=1 Tax=Steinernema glaseri TaxID=37863 RepID=A0A1I7Z0J2_9BILA